MKFLFLASTILPLYLSDTAADCHYEEIKGKWLLHYTDGGLDNSVNCNDPNLEFKHTVEVSLDNINEVTRLDNFNSKGWFTLIYQQGFEIVLDQRKWFAYFWYNSEVNPWDYDNPIPDDVEVYDCMRTAPGWVHDVMSNDWACFYGKKVETETFKIASHNFIKSRQEPYIFDTYKSSSKPKHVSEFLQTSTKTENFNSRPKTKKEIKNKIKNSIITMKNSELTASVPQNFDWNDSNKVSPVKNQNSCGSCYAFASVGMYEARARVQTDNQWQPLFSEQEIVSCSAYSQGCNGGFPYLISKYAQDFGIVDTSCMAYNASDVECTSEYLDNSCFRYKVADYGYVGDHYGGATEYLIRKEVFENGPIAVSMDANCLHDYDSGVWIQPGNTETCDDAPVNGETSLRYDPYEYTNHVVLITGWGWDSETGLPFWNVKNSWGTDFGENGYFRIIRGIDNADIESLPAWSTMIPPYNV